MVHRAGPARARPFSLRSFGKIRDPGEKSSEKSRKHFLSGLLDSGLTFWYDMGMKGNEPMKKQAKIIFYATDQSATCIDEETQENPFKDMVEAERVKGNYYGLSTFEYRKLCGESGYEWLEIHHNGDYGSDYVAKSDKYIFNGFEAEQKIEIGDTVFWNGDVKRGNGLT